MALFLRGICKGIRTHERKWKDSTFTDVFVGLDALIDDGYGGKRSEIVEAQLSQAQVDSGLIGTLNSVKGKDVLLPVWVATYASKDNVDSKGYPRSGYRLRVSGDGAPLVLPSAKNPA